MHPLCSRLLLVSSNVNIQKSLFLLAALVSACATSSDLPEARPLPALEPEAPKAEVKIDGSLDAYLAHAVATRPELSANVARWHAARHRVDAVDELGSPTVSYGLFLQSVETRVGPQRHRVSVQQPIPWPAKASSREDVERARVLVEEARYDVATLDVLWQVGDAYWRLWEVDRVHRWHEEHIAIVEALAASARARVEIGTALVADVGQTELVISRTMDMIQAAHEAHAQASIELARAAGLEPTVERLPIADREPQPRLPAESEAELNEAAAATPQIETIERMQLVREQEAEAALKARYPDFGVGVDWIETGAAADPTMPDSGKDPVIAMVSVKVPLWSGENVAAAEAAKAEKLALEAEQESAQRNSIAAVQKTLADIRETARRARLYRQTLIPQAEAVLGSVRGAYEVGKSGIASILLAQNELLSLRVALARTLAEHERHWVMLERLVGRPVAAEGIGNE